MTEFAAPTFVSVAVKASCQPQTPNLVSDVRTDVHKATHVSLARTLATSATLSWGRLVFVASTLAPVPLLGGLLQLVPNLAQSAQTLAPPVTHACPMATWETFVCLYQAHAASTCALVALLVGWPHTRLRRASPATILAKRTILAILSKAPATVVSLPTPPLFKDQLQCFPVVHTLVSALKRASLHRPTQRPAHGALTVARTAILATLLAILETNVCL
mmetsp:Transcript_49605/g.97258  ORF Transcript_49605/g.97258 Transcript_49605/m.97258 type:complete len:218 (-) Transcript_49605:8883-9536(-)